MYYTVIQHDGHLSTQRKCRKRELQASVLFIFTFLEYRGIVVFFVLYSDKPWVFYQSECVQGPVYIIIGYYSRVQVLYCKLKTKFFPLHFMAFMELEAWVP